MRGKNPTQSQQNRNQALSLWPVSAATLGLVVSVDMVLAGCTGDSGFCSGNGHGVGRFHRPYSGSGANKLAFKVKKPV